MALEDFVSQEEESQVDLRPVQHRIDFNDPANEDLFGFEDLTVLPDGTPPERASAAPAAPPVAEPGSMPPAAAATDDDDEDLFDFADLSGTPSAREPLDTPAAEPPPVAAPEPGPAAVKVPVSTPPRVESEADDLLDEIAPAIPQPAIDGPAIPQPAIDEPAIDEPAIPETANPEPGPSADRAASEPAVDEVAEWPSGVGPEPAMPRRARGLVREPAQRVAFTEDELPSLVLPARGDLPRPGLGLPVALIACFLALNVALVLFAWRTSSSFEHTMAEITDAVSNAALEARTIAEMSAPGPNTASGAATASPRTANGLEPGLVPSAVANFHELSLKIAREHLARGSFAEARLTVNHMLANKARADVGAVLQAEAEFLIAESYYQQALATPPSGKDEDR